MTQSEILSLPADEVYRRVAEMLWPWDGDNSFYVELGRRLRNCDGVGWMVEAMKERGWAATVIYAQTFVRAIFWDLSANLNSAKSDASTAWEAVARACLLALESEAGK